MQQGLRRHLGGTCKPIRSDAQTLAQTAKRTAPSATPQLCVTERFGGSGTKIGRLVRENPSRGCPTRTAVATYDLDLNGRNREAAFAKFGAEGRLEVLKLLDDFRAA